MKEEASKLLVVKEDIVNAALEKTLAGGDLVRETIGHQDPIFLPNLKRAEETLRISIPARPSPFSP